MNNWSRILQLTNPCRLIITYRAMQYCVVGCPISRQIHICRQRHALKLNFYLFFFIYLFFSVQQCSFYCLLIFCIPFFLLAWRKYSWYVFYSFSLHTHNKCLDSREQQKILTSCFTNVKTFETDLIGPLGLNWSIPTEENVNYIHPKPVLPFFFTALLIISKVAVHN